MKSVIAALLVLVSVASLTAQGPLTDQNIAAALIAGAKAKGKHQGLILRDVGRSWMNAMSSSAVVPQSGGFWLEIFTPISWLRHQASLSAAKYQTLPAPLPPEFFEPVLRVIVHPDTPLVFDGGVSVTHVVLRDMAKRMAIQPIAIEPFDEELSNAMGGRRSFRGAVAKFPVDGLREVRGPNGVGEFYVTIISGGEKDFQIKQKHFKDLR